MTIFWRAYRYEVYKLVRMRSTWILTGLATVAATVPLVLSTMWFRDNALGATRRPLDEFDPVALSTSQLTLAAVFLAILGILFTSFEFKGGAVRASMLSFPNRGVDYGAKILACATLVTGFGVVMAPTSFFITQAILGDIHSVSIWSDGALRSVLGAVLYLALITVFGMTITFAFRSAAGSIGVLIPTMLVLSTMLAQVPVGWLSTTAQFLPDAAGTRMMRVHTPDHAVLGPLTGGIVLAVWVLVLGGISFEMHRRRDIVQ